MTTTFSLKYRLESLRYPYNSDEVRKRVPTDRIGVYAIWEPSVVPGGFRCVYLGKSEISVRRRLLDHLRPNEPNADLRRNIDLFRDILRFSAAYTKTPQEADLLEKRIIRDWGPDANHLHR